MEEKPKKKYTRRAPTKDAPLGFTREGKVKVRRGYTQVRTGVEAIKPDVVKLSEVSNHAKYYYPVMIWAMWKSGLRRDQIELMILLYDEYAFNGRMVKPFCDLMGLHTGVFYYLVKDGWIIHLSKPLDRKKRVYQLSDRAKRMISSMYRKMALKEPISTIKEVNDLTKITNSKCSDYMFSSFNKVQRDFELEQNGIDTNVKVKNGRNHAWKQKREE